MTYKEIRDIAELINVEKATIDKDWILGHFLNAMFHFNDIKNNFVFKGGTCLKKCYFGDYRFSEDLDFTLLDKNFLVDESFINEIIHVAEMNSGAKFHLKEIKRQLHLNIPQGYEITVQFWGANHKPNQRPLPTSRWQTKIKIDVSFFETILLQPLHKKIFHPYSDNSKIINSIPVYPINEIIAEKIRALIQRNRPRDIYDLYYLSSSVKNLDSNNIFQLFQQKAINKSVIWNGIDDFINERKFNINKRAWESSLNYHLPKDSLIDFETAYAKVGSFIKKILQ